MILRQLIQTGRRFCECRSRDFIPKSEDEVVVVAYTIHDQFIAHSFDVDLPNLIDSVHGWLCENDSVGYILIRRECHSFQTEFPSPLGRRPMDRLTLSAATSEAFQNESYFIEKLPKLNACKLLPTSSARTASKLQPKNLLHPQKTPFTDPRHAHFPEFSEFAS